MKGKNIFWGAFFVLAAILIIAGQLTSFAVIGFWSILAGVVLAAAFISSLVRLNFVGILLSLALGYIVFQTPLGLPFINGWLLILAALLAGGGLSMIIRRRSHSGWDHRTNWSGQIEDGKYPSHGGARPEMEYNVNEDDNNPLAEVRFGGKSRYLHSTALQNGQFSASFGALEVYFDEAKLAGDSAQINCDVSFGAIELYVPRHWQVEDRLNTFMGGVSNEERYARPEENSPLLIVTGSVNFGAVEVKYV